mgnify:CR=1 FL=1
MHANAAMRAWGKHYEAKHFDTKASVHTWRRLGKQARNAALADLRTLIEGGSELTETKLTAVAKRLRNKSSIQRADARTCRVRKVQRKAKVAKPVSASVLVEHRCSQSGDWGAFHKQTLEAKDGAWKDFWTQFKHVKS